MSIVGDGPDALVRVRHAAVPARWPDRSITAALNPAALDPAALDPAALDPAALDPRGLDPAERERVERAASADQPAVALSLLLLRALAAEACGLPADALRVDRRCPRCGATTHGVPRVRRADGGPVPHLSLSRCRDRVLVAASATGPIGVDLEHADVEPTARAALAPTEGAPPGPEQAGTARDPHPVRAWARTWARTEALLKAAGTGLAVDPRAVRVSDAAGRPVVAGDPPPPPVGTHWWLTDLDLGPAHVGALALALPDGPPPRIDTREVDPRAIHPPR